VASDSGTQQDEEAGKAFSPQTAEKKHDKLLVFRRIRI
jgi:hypothetical protein